MHLLTDCHYPADIQRQIPKTTPKQKMVLRPNKDKKNSQIDADNTIFLSAGAQILPFKKRWRL
jgi:hypothetical protein